VQSRVEEEEARWKAETEKQGNWERKQRAKQESKRMSAKPERRAEAERPKGGEGGLKRTHPREALQPPAYEPPPWSVQSQASKKRIETMRQEHDEFCEEMFEDANEVHMAALAMKEKREELRTAQREQ